jgi:hypothetical protein
MIDHKARHTLAMNLHLAHDNRRLRDALKVIAEMAERSTSALTMSDIARIARGALIAVPCENAELRHPENAEKETRS